MVQDLLSERRPPQESRKAVICLDGGAAQGFNSAFAEESGSAPLGAPPPAPARRTPKPLEWRPRPGAHAPARLAVFPRSRHDHASAQKPGDRPSGNILATRSPAVGRHGMIATSQSLASAAGLRALQEGGNAIDAAVTAAAVLAVVEPSMNGIGGDLFAIVYDATTQAASMRSTPADAPPAAATPAEFARRGLTEMPGSGPLSVDVPGVVERLGRAARAASARSRWTRRWRRRSATPATASRWPS